MAIDPAIRDHQTWLGYLQPDGLVVSPTALVDAQVAVNANTLSLQQRFLPFIEEVDLHDNLVAALRDIGTFLREFLDWPAERLIGKGCAEPIPEPLKAPLREFGETLEPDWAFIDPHPADATRPWLLLAQDLPLGTDLDVPVESVEAGWAASPTRRFERLLREVEVPIGLISNRTHLRLIYAPRGENAGTLTFPVAAMSEVAGRSILAALDMLLCRYRLLAAPSEALLPALLKRSRDYQARVSTALSKQVLNSLYELLRGFQAANEQNHGDLLRQVLAEHPDEVYNGLLTVLMRLVFLLYAEDRGLMPGSDLYVRNYAIHSLFERLRTDAQQYPDTMDHRYGAWAQFVALFRAVHDGCDHKLLKLPSREGHLFDPDRFPFLEGRTTTGARLPLVADGVIHRVLSNLLLLGGERLSYRTLDVEQIGSVYETMMGFRLEMAQGMTIALEPGKAQGAPVPVNLEELLRTTPDQRGKWIHERTDYKLTGTMTNAIKSADSVDALLATLERRIARSATPHPVPPGTMILVPTDERRRTGSHYTPRSLTGPIVRKALEPILMQLGESPTPDQVLNLKICDPAMGSGAFLVEACRQLADELVKAWATHGWKPFIPPDEDELLHARRIIAQRCLYGVDRNPMAVDLAKLSLWLTTLAREHPFTFLDHSLRAGDSLVGLTHRQISGFHWAPERQISFLENHIRERLEIVSRERRQILDSGDQMPPGNKRQKLQVADDSLNTIRLLSDVIVSAFFHGDKMKAREERLTLLYEKVQDRYAHNQFLAVMDLNAAAQELQTGEHQITPFHWEIEFPEVFAPDRGGFDAIVGNPPFAGKNTLIKGNRVYYLDWLQAVYEEAHGNSDLVALFFRRAFGLLRPNGAFGLIATNTIGQGDTRHTGLRWICTHGGTIYAAIKRLKWPGVAAVVVSVVHVAKGQAAGPFELDGCPVPGISAYLFHAGGHESPTPLSANAGKSFQGSIILGMGFTFDDTDTKGVATPLAELQRLISKDARNAERVFPYLGGEEVNTSPIHAPHRFVINFGDYPLRREELSNTWLAADDRERAAWLRTGIVPLDYPGPVAADWPDLLAIVETKVKPVRVLLTANAIGKKRATFWWHYGSSAQELYAAISGSTRVIAISRVGEKMGFAFVPTSMVYADSVVLFPYSTCSAFCALQARPHEIWARFFASSMKDDLRYTPSDCFETFPFSPGFEANQAIEAAGKIYYEFRADLMIRNSEGLTKTYNRFHDPNETSPDIIKLRELHAAMDRAVLDAYGWSDIQPTCEFLLDYEEDEDDDEGNSRRRKPWRYRWPDDIHDEVLARLLALNAERAEAERRIGQAAAEAARAAAAKAPRTKPKNSFRKSISAGAHLPGMPEA